MRRKFLLAWIGVLILWSVFPALAQNGSYSNDELDRLVGPIALFPDPLLANVLAGSTQPEQLKAAYAFTRSGKKVEPGKSGWGSSVEALTCYPDVLSMMVANPDWTQGLGWATANQLADVTSAVQRFRFQAKTAGNLKSDGKIKVIEEGTMIRIEPANPQVIYVPSYETQTVLVSQPATFGTVLSYSAAIATNVLLWQHVFHWHDCHFYHHPYGWVPPAAYYRPYGWRSTGIYNRSNVWAPDRTTIVNRPVNVNFNNIHIHAKGNRPAGNVGRPPSAGNVRVPHGGNPRPRVRPQPRPSVSNRGPGPAGGGLEGLRDYSSAGQTTRESMRGAASRGRSGAGRRGR